MTPKIPSSLKVEHEELHKNLTEIIGFVGEIGRAAKKVADLLHPHFEAEERLAMPPLGLLKSLAVGEYPLNSESVVQTTERLKQELPKMLSEHQQILKALNELKEIAARENNLQAKAFAEKLMLHALTEEQVLYPAAILVGELLRIKLSQNTEVQAGQH